MGIRDTIEKITIICGFIGMLSMIPVTTESYRVSKNRVIYSIVLLVVFLILFPCHVIFSETEDRMTDNIMYTFRRVMNPLFLVMVIAWGLYRRNDFVQLANSLCRCANDLELLTGRRSHIQMMNYSTSSFLVWMSMCVVKFRYLTDMISDLTEVVIFIYLYIFAIHWASHVFIIEQLLHDVKNGLEEVMTGPQNDQVRLRRLQQFKNIYHTIFLRSLTVTRCFSVIVVYVIIYLSTILVVSGYFTVDIFKELLAKKTWQVLEETVISVQWNIFAFTALCYFVYPCEKASSQSEEIVYAVNGYLVRSQSKEIVQELHQFSVLLLHEKIQFTPCDLFDFNYGLLLTIAGAGLSYVVVLTEMSVKIDALEREVGNATEKHTITTL